jgi:phage recombination protein Bet
MTTKKSDKKKKEEGLMPREEAQTLTKRNRAQERAALIKNKLMPPQSSNDELAMFLTFCKRRALDPFVNQVSCARIKGKLVFMTQIDGLRLIAQRTGCYAPSSKAAEYAYKKDDKGNERLYSCRVWVLKFVNDKPFEFEGLAFYDEQVGRKGDGTVKENWHNMPRHMLAIRAESFALRKGFPAELSGLYTKEEIEDTIFRESGESPTALANGGGVAGAKAALKEAPPEDTETTAPSIIDAAAEDAQGFAPTCKSCNGLLKAIDVDQGKCVDKTCDKHDEVVKL